MNPEWLRSLHGGGKGSLINTALEHTGRFVGDALHAMGIRGPVGIDCMVVRQEGAVRFLPILEINPRYTMGRIALELHRSTGLRGGWFFLDDGAIERAGYSDRAAFAGAVEGTAGVAFTSEPTTATRVLTVMVGSTNATDAAECWRSLGFDWPD